MVVVALLLSDVATSPGETWRVHGLPPTTTIRRQSDTLREKACTHIIVELRSRSRASCTFRTCIRILAFLLLDIEVFLHHVRELAVCYAPSDASVPAQRTWQMACQSSFTRGEPIDESVVSKRCVNVCLPTEDSSHRLSPTPLLEWFLRCGAHFQCREP